MKLKDIMTDDVHAVHIRDTATKAAKIMRKHDIGILPVLDENEDLVGAVTDRDIAVRAVANGTDPIATQVRAIMTRNLNTCDVEQTPEDAAQCMQNRQIRRLFVVDGDKKKLRGVVGLQDLMHAENGHSLVQDTVMHVVG
jgi:CBS domain-containing protein